MRLSANRLGSAVIAAMLLLICQAVFAGPLRERLQERRTAQQDQAQEESTAAKRPLPPGARLLRNIPYGTDNLQRMDVYLPQQVAGPVIFMVHGGGWRHGDKTMRSVVDNKVARWLPKGLVFISANYRLLPDATPLQQAEDIAKALASAQGKATEWGAEPDKFILMGHSAGAHLVALLTASPTLAAKSGVQPWLGTVALDSAALDLVQIMQTPRHARFYDQAFGSDPVFWQAVSPYHQLSAPTSPILAVCSTKHTQACPQAQRFTSKAASFGTHVQVLQQDLSHREVNQQLGEDNGYTRAVEAFMGTLDKSARQALAN